MNSKENFSEGSISNKIDKTVVLIDDSHNNGDPSFQNIEHFPMLNTKHSSFEHLSDSNGLLFTQAARYFHDDFEKDLQFVFSKKMTELERVNAKLFNQNRKKREKLIDVARNNGIAVQEPDINRFTHKLNQKIEEDIASNLHQVNKKYFLNETGQFVEPFQEIIDVDSRHEIISTSLPDFFDVVQIDKLLHSERIIFKLFLDELIMTFSRKFNSIEILFSLLEEKMKKYQDFILINRFDEKQLTDEIKLNKAQKLTDKIFQLWKAVKNHKNFNTFSLGKNFRWLCVKKFKNKFFKDDFVIQWKNIQDDENGDNRDLKTANSNPEFGDRRLSKIKLKIFLDETFVYETPAFNVKNQHKVCKEINLILSKRPQFLRFECYEKNIFWNLIDEAQILLSFGGINSEELLSDVKHSVTFIKKTNSMNADSKCFEIDNIQNLDFAKNKIDQSNGRNLENEQNQKIVIDQNDSLAKNDQKLNEDGNQTMDSLSKTISKFRALKINEEMSLSLSFVTGFVIASTKNKKTTSQQIDFVKKFEPSKQIKETVDVNDPRTAYQTENQLQESISEIKKIDNQIFNAKNVSIRFEILKFNKQFNSSLPVCLSHNDFLNNNNLIFEVETQMQKISKSKKEYTFLQSLEHLLFNSKWKAYFSQKYNDEQIQLSKKIESIILQTFVRQNRKCALEFKEIIREFEFDDSPSTFSIMIANIFKPKRKFKPLVTETMVQGIHEKRKFLLIANFFRGFNFPMRKFKENALNQLQVSTSKQTGLVNQSGLHNLMANLSKHLKKSDSQTQKLSQNNLFLKIKTCVGDQIEEFCSDSVTGSDPCWNLHIERAIDLTAVENANFLEVQNYLGEITVLVFDDLQVIDPNDYQNRIVTKIERRFIGSLKVSVIDVVRNGKIFGNFKMLKPIVIFGYHHSRNQNNSYFQSKKQFAANEFKAKESQKAKEVLLNNSIKVEVQKGMQLQNESGFQNQENSGIENNSKVIGQSNVMQKSLHQTKKMSNTQENAFLDILNPFIFMTLDMRIHVDPIIKFEEKFWCIKSDWTIYNELLHGNYSFIKNDKNKLPLVKSFLDEAQKLKIEERLYLLTETLNGEITLLHNFIDQNVSQSIIDSHFSPFDEFTHKKLAYYVSLIEDEQNVRELQNLTLTNQQVIQGRKARNIEKAFLLANYYLAIEKEPESSHIFIVIGQNKFGNRVACVMKKQNKYYEIWNPQNAEVIVLKQVSLKAKRRSWDISIFRREDQK